MNPNPTITTGGTAVMICQSSSLQTTTLAYTATANGPTSYSIVWNGAAHTAGLADQGNTTFAFAAGGGTITGIVITAGTIAGGPYSGVMTITNGNGCTNTHAVTVTVNPLPIAPTITTTDVCYNSNAVFTIHGTTGDVVTYSGAASGTVTIGVSGTADVTVPTVITNITLE